MRLYSNRIKCTGCYACANTCPESCIKLVLDEEGFRYPVIDETHCINCGKCAEVCPIDKDIARDGILEIPLAYACYNKDDVVRQESSSGGISYTLARQVIDSNGVVFGVAGSVICGVYHTHADNIEGVKKMCKSKYLQSDVGFTFRKTKELLKQGKTVFFTGTPCQIAGLYSYLGNESPNLFTADLICHGVPSETVFHKHIEEIKKNDKCEVVDVYRDKAQGWKPTQSTYVYRDGTKKTVPNATNVYNRGFISNLFQRNSCYTCKYAVIPRIADISLGDYFGGTKYKEYDVDNKGLSLITVNTEKGKILFEKIEEQLFYKKFSIETVVNESEHLAHPPSYNILRDLFFKLIKTRTYSETADLLLPTRFLPRIRKKFILEICILKARLKNNENNKLN